MYAMSGAGSTNQARYGHNEQMVKQQTGFRTPNGAGGSTLQREINQQ